MMESPTVCQFSWKEAILNYITLCVMPDLKDDEMDDEMHKMAGKVRKKSSFAPAVFVGAIVTLYYKSIKTRGALVRATNFLLPTMPTLMLETVNLLYAE